MMKSEIRLIHAGASFDVNSHVCSLCLKRSLGRVWLYPGDFG